MCLSTGCRKLKTLTGEKKHLKVQGSGVFLYKKLEVPLLSNNLYAKDNGESITTPSSFSPFICTQSHYSVIKIRRVFSVIVNLVLSAHEDVSVSLSRYDPPGV